MDTMEDRNRFWRIAIALGVAELAVLLTALYALALWNGGLVITIGSHAEQAREPIVIPVAGVRAVDLKDSFGAKRDGGRSHLGVDIFAPEGTPVRAAADAVVVERTERGAGGRALYLRGTDQTTIYYYAHLSRYRSGLQAGHFVRRGETVGYVGRTGNVQGSAHLHFAVYTVRDPNRWWTGRNLNPYRLLTDD